MESRNENVISRGGYSVQISSLMIKVVGGTQSGPPLFKKNWREMPLSSWCETNSFQIVNVESFHQSRLFQCPALPIQSIRH